MAGLAREKRSKNLLNLGIIGNCWDIGHTIKKLSSGAWNMDPPNIGEEERFKAAPPSAPKSLDYGKTLDLISIRIILE